MIPLGRLGDAEADVGRAVVYLAGKDGKLRHRHHADGRRRVQLPALTRIFTWRSLWWSNSSSPRSTRSSSAT